MADEPRKPKNEFVYDPDFDFVAAIREALADDEATIRASFFAMLDGKSPEELKVSNPKLGIEWLERKAGVPAGTLNNYLLRLAREYKRDPKKKR